MDNLKISFIGAGNMACSLIGGLIADGMTPANINIADINNEQLNKLQQHFGVTICPSNSAATDAADVLVLAVKPQGLKQVAEEIHNNVQSNKPLVISIAAGIQAQDINRWLGNDVAIVHPMPNTPSLIQTGATGLYANDKVTDDQRNIAETIMRAVGVAVWVKNEQQMDVVTAISGSGPAYYFLFMEAMQAAGEELGLDAETARLLTLQTAFGATKMALESSDDCATLRQRVTSPGGTTEQALHTFEEGQLRQLIKQAVTAATKRSQELAQLLGEKHT
ncbi:MAG TPA: pyrroline-5-carboxylate reductase [Candidatus Tenderia electrophaga]|uniref:Pyrroline-5-carboxylate reductase n=1 Tax=Candidatus Tenderia electrophaga TaxID=1748243 RepID=A0A832N6S4_9GAMM|nr:pyrroline-5-carboxylate reductase [Candidatus Tenderia electrophaga]